MNFNQITQLFQAEMMSKEITPSSYIIADSQLHRFYVEGDKQGSKNGWYILFADNVVPSGVFGTWKIGLTHIWCSKKRQYMSQYELEEHKKQIVQAKRKFEEERLKAQQEAANRAEKLWESRTYITYSIHPYLISKQIGICCARWLGDSLALPIIDLDGKIWSLQFIRPDGTKMMLTDGAITSHFIPVQGNPNEGRKILICEGFATGATLVQHYPNDCVIAACNAGNLKPVALLIRQKFPKVEMIICADDDRLKKENTGLIKAHEAAIASGSLFTRPEWPEGSPKSLSDFNDLACWLKSKEVQYEHE
jgi:putative DNA primase/helicase